MDKNVYSVQLTARPDKATKKHKVGILIAKNNRVVDPNSLPEKELNMYVSVLLESANTINEILLTKVKQNSN